MLDTTIFENKCMQKPQFDKVGYSYPSQLILFSNPLHVQMTVLSLNTSDEVIMLIIGE